MVHGPGVLYEEPPGLSPSPSWLPTYCCCQGVIERQEKMFPILSHTLLFLILVLIIVIPEMQGKSRCKCTGGIEIGEEANHNTRHVDAVVS